MTLDELKKNFLLSERLPSEEEYKKNKYSSTQLVIIEGKAYWLIFRTRLERIMYEYLENSNNYKAKESLFGIGIKKGYAYVSKQSLPFFIQLVLPQKWVIEDRNIKRELSIVVTNGDNPNKNLLHELYSKTRDLKIS